MVEHLPSVCPAPQWLWVTLLSVRDGGRKGWGGGGGVTKREDVSKLNTWIYAVLTEHHTQLLRGVAINVDQSQGHKTSLGKLKELKSNEEHNGIKLILKKINGI